MRMVRERGHGRGLTACIFAGLMGVGVGEVKGQDIGIEVGARAPAVQIEDLEGNAVDLGQWIGKKPVLFQFWATWCPLCKALEPQIAAAKAAHGDAVEFVLVAVAVNQTKRSIQRHMDRHPLPAQLLWDTEGRATRALKAPTTSYVVILDRDGRVAYTGVGDDQDLATAVAKVAR